ncbi:MAG: hypothetical protein ACOC20_02625 [Oceanicaulis sp.]
MDADFFETNSAARRRAMAEARDPADLARRMEACGAWLRLDPGRERVLFHAATASSPCGARSRTPCALAG